VPSASRWKDSRFGIGFAVLILLVVGVPEYFVYRDHGGQLVEVHCFELGGVPHALAIDELRPGAGVDSGGYPYQGLSVLDLQSGALKVRRVVRDSRAFIGATGELLWFGAREPLARGAERLDEVVPAGKAAERILAANSAIRGVASLEVDPGSGRLLATSSDGYAYWVDPRSFAATQGGQVPRRVRLDSTLAQRASAGHRLALEGSPRKTLMRGGKPVGAESYLEASFLEDVPSQRAIELDAPPGVVVVHRDRLGDGSQFRLTRVGLDGRPTWTVTQEQVGIRRGVLLYARALPDRIVVFVKGGLPRGAFPPEDPSQAFAVAVADGRVLWNKPLGLP